MGFDEQQSAKLENVGLEFGKKFAYTYVQGGPVQLNLTYVVEFRYTLHYTQRQKYWSKSEADAAPALPRGWAPRAAGAGARGGRTKNKRPSDRAKSTECGWSGLGRTWQRPLERDQEHV